MREKLSEVKVNNIEGVEGLYLNNIESERVFCLKMCSSIKDKNSIGRKKFLKDILMPVIEE